jgi:hypothetical protein
MAGGSKNGPMPARLDNFVTRERAARNSQKKYVVEKIRMMTPRIAVSDQGRDRLLS